MTSAYPDTSITSVMKLKERGNFMRARYSFVRMNFNSVPIVKVYIPAAHSPLDTSLTRNPKALPICGLFLIFHMRSGQLRFLNGYTTVEGYSVCYMSGLTAFPMSGR